MAGRKKNRFLVAAIVLLCFGHQAAAQSETDFRNLEPIEEQSAEGVYEEADYTDFYSFLSYYSEHPLNLNQADALSLQQLYFLNPVQVQSLLEHREKFGNLLSIYELQVIPNFDLRTIERLRPYVTLGAVENSPNLQTCLTEGRTEIYGRFITTLEQEAGYVEDNPRYKFTGSPYGIQVRYNYRFGSRLSYGFVSEKDAGEQLASQGFDFHSLHIFYRGEKHLKALALGDYQVQFGQGLAVWSALGFGKTSDVLSTARIARGIIPSRSANEAQFFRGVAARLQFGSFQCSVFGSRRRIDGNILTDSLGSISSILLSGYHRNEAELQDRKTILETAAGGELKFEKRNLTIGVTGIYNSYGTEIGTPAGYYIPGRPGQQNIVTGAHYSFTWRNAYFFGELAHTIGRGAAGSQGLLISLDPKLDFSLFYRNYGRDYFSPYGNAIGEATSNSNEEGIYTGIAYRFLPKWQMKAYADFFNFPWLRYRVGAPSHGYDYLGQLEYQSGKTLKAYIRYKHEVKELNISASPEKTYDPQPVKNEHLRLQWQKAFTPNLTLRTRAEFSWYRHAQNPVEKGFLAFQDVEYAFDAIPLKLSARYTFFDIGSYNARIYTYEDDVRYSFSIPFFQDQGARYYLLAQYRFVRGFTAYARIARTQVYNRETIGSGLNEIPAPHHTEIRFSLRYTFDMK